MTNKTTVRNYIVKVLEPNSIPDSWNEVGTFAFFEDADDFARATTIGQTKVFERLTTTIVDEVDLK